MNVVYLLLVYIFHSGSVAFQLNEVFPVGTMTNTKRWLSSSNPEPSKYSSSSEITKSSPRPINAEGWPDLFPAKDHCSRCGLCETSFVNRVKDACALLPANGMSRMHDLEVDVHGRSRNIESMDTTWIDHSEKMKKMMSANTASSPASVDALPDTRTKDDVPATTTVGFAIADEGRFGVMHEPIRLARGIDIQGSQWTGVVTGIALSMLESGQVDAVVCIASKNDDKDDGCSDDDSSVASSTWSSPEPILARTPEEVLRGRGVKPALAPSLKVLDEIRHDESIKRLLFCGVGCSVQAFRAIQDSLHHLSEVYVLGTNCVDNSPTPTAATKFIQDGVQVPSNKRVLGYEFMQDFRVHVKTEDEYITKPYFSLPGTIAEPSIAKSCLACFDYTNGLADVVVGYMGAPLEKNTRMDESYQTLTIRNEVGAKMIQTAVNSGRLYVDSIAQGHGAHEQITLATVQADAIVQSMTGGEVKKEGLPKWVGEVMAFAMRTIGPKGINFARYSIDYHILRNYLHVLDVWGDDGVEKMLPTYSKEIVKHYLAMEDGTLETLRSKISK